MHSQHKKPTRRRLLQGAALGASGLVLPGKAPAQGGRKPFQGTTLNVSCWNGPYPKFLGDYVVEFEEMTGAKVNYDTPAFPIYNQRADLELSTKGSAFDVLNITFIYASRWIGAGWFLPLDDFINDPRRTPREWDATDFLAGLTTPMKDKAGKLYGIPWIADAFMAGTPRNDIVAASGLKLPDTFDEVASFCKQLHGKDGLPAYLAENNYGWTFIPWLQGFGGNVFRNPPDDLMPTLDSPEAIEAAEFYAKLLTTYGPSGVLSYNYDQVAQQLKQGRAIYSTNGLPYLMQMAAEDSRVATTCNFALMPAGPKGRFPGVGTHGWGIPTGSRNKDAAWEFIRWAMSKELVQRMMSEKRYTSITRKSLINAPDFKKQMTVNGVDVADLYQKTIDLASSGYMKYRTVHVFPLLNKQIAIAIEQIGSGQLPAAEAMRKAQEGSIAELRRAGVKL